MKILVQTSIAVVFVFLLFSCKKETSIEKQEKSYAELKKANWLLGRWENNSSEGTLSESWKKLNDSTFYGESYFVIEYDTVFAETIQLEERNGKLSYIVTVPNQNEEKPVSFELTKNLQHQLIFENPNHDFPSKIIYNQVGTDSLIAEISGMKEGKLKSEFFKMKKIN